jgi:hypothetical protein
LLNASRKQNYTRFMKNLSGIGSSVNLQIKLLKKKKEDTMFNKLKSFVVVILVLSGLALLMSSQAWAGPPKAQTVIYTDSYTGENLIKVVFDDNGDLKDVYYWDKVTGDWSADPIIGQQAIMCTCVDNGADCEDSLSANIVKNGVIVDCHEIDNSAGSGASGCPLYGSPAYLYGGFIFGGALPPPPPL